MEGKIEIKDIKEMFRAQRERANRALAHRQMVKDLKEERRLDFVERDVALKEQRGLTNTVSHLVATGEGWGY